MAPQGADHYAGPLGHIRTPCSSAACAYPACVLPSSSSSWELFVTLETRLGLPHPPQPRRASPARQACMEIPQPSSPIKNTPGSEWG